MLRAKKYLQICFLSVFFVICLTMLTKTAYADEYLTFIGDVQITDDNRDDVLGDGTVSYVPAAEGSSAKLILNGMQLKTYSERLIGKQGEPAACGIYTEQALEVVLQGRNVVTVIHDRMDVECCCGIYQKGNDNYLRFSGDGSLTVVVDQAISRSFGIYAENLVLTGKVSLNVSGGNVLSGNNAPTCISYGIFAKGRMRVINEAKVIATAGQANKSYGIYIDEDVLQVKDRGYVKAQGKMSISLKKDAMLMVTQEVRPFITVSQNEDGSESFAWNGTALWDYCYAEIDAAKAAKEEVKENVKKTDYTRVIMLTGLAVLLLGASIVVWFATKTFKNRK